ncbi:MAG: Rieske (2Fe-2S) protein [Planctomycetota bacterium]
MTAGGRRWVAIGRPDELQFTPGAAVRIGDHWIAVFPLQGEPDRQWVAIDNACPHAGAPLCDGAVLDGKVVCSLHLWEFDLRTGACDIGADWNVRTWPVRLRDGVLEVEVGPD